jgi:TolB-like protein
VLPLALLGADPSLGHFAEGLIEEVMAALGRIEGVRVVARISVTGLLGMGLEARELGRRLDARAILEGSIRQAENRLRVNANLVNVPDGCRVWSGSFDGLVDDPFAAQERLAHDIIDGLRKALDALRSG